MGRGGLDIFPVCRCSLPYRTQSDHALDDEGYACRRLKLHGSLRSATLVHSSLAVLTKLTSLCYMASSALHTFPSLPQLERLHLGVLQTGMEQSTLHMALPSLASLYLSTVDRWELPVRAAPSIL